MLILFSFFFLAEESQKRREFFDEHGEVLPKDLCTCIENEPTKWKIVPESIGGLEELPEIDGELLAQVGVFGLPLSISKCLILDTFLGEEVLRVYEIEYGRGFCRNNAIRVAYNL